MTPFEIVNFARKPDGTALNGQQEVVGYGRVRPNKGGGNEVGIEVMLAPVDRFGRFDANLLPTSHWIGCGHWQLAFIGSRWQNGISAGHRQRNVEAVTVSEASEIHLGEVSVEEGERYFHVGPGDAPCFRVRLASGPKDSAIVPVMEVVRALFGVSSGFIKQAMDGLRDPALVPNRPLISRSRSGVKDNVPHLYSHGRLTMAEALLYASIVTDRAMRIAHDGIHQYLSLSAIFRQGMPDFAKMSFPFNAPCEWRIEKEWIKLKRGGREAKAHMVITRIHSIMLPLVTSEISVSFPSPAAGEPAVRGTVQIKFPRASRLQLTSARAPSPVSPVHSLGAGPSTLMTRQAIEIIDVPRAMPAVGGPLGIPSDLEGDVDASTDDAVSGGDADTARVTVSQNSRITVVPGPDFVDPWLLSQRATVAALAWLVEKDGWRWVGAAPDPVSPALTRVVDTAGGWDSGFVFVEVVTDGVHIMLVDVGTAESDPHALGLVMRDGRGASDEATRAVVRDATAKSRGTWLKPTIAGCQTLGVRRHASTMNDPETYAKLIRKACIRLSGMVAGQ